MSRKKGQAYTAEQKTRIVLEMPKKNQAKPSLERGQIREQKEVI